MTTPEQSRVALDLVATRAANDAAAIASRLSGSPSQQRAGLLELIPPVIGYYSDGSSALAADFYDDTRAAAAAKGTYTAELIVLDRTVKIRRAVAWASEPLFAEMEDTVERRLGEVVHGEVSRPYRDTITTNSHRDPASVGWQRVTGDCCRFCQMLGDRGARYSAETARFAAHPNCNCSAMPVFDGVMAIGPEASPMQYMASKRSKTPKQKAAVKAYLDTYYPA